MMLVKSVPVIDLIRAPFIDTSASMVLEQAITSMRELGDTVIVFGTRDAVRDTLQRTGVLRLLEEKQLAAS